MSPAALNLSANSSSKILLEQILEAAVIGFDDGVLGREIERIFAGQRVIHRGAREIDDRLIEIVHRHGDAAAGEIEHFALDLLAVLADPGERQLARARHQEIGARDTGRHRHGGR